MWLEFWYKALHEPIGFRFRTNDREGFRKRLYAARAASGDPQLQQLGIVLPSEPADEVWIIHQKIPQELADAPAKE